MRLSASKLELSFLNKINYDEITVFRCKAEWGSVILVGFDEFQGPKIIFIHTVRTYNIINMSK